MLSKISLAILALAVWQCESQSIRSMSGGSDIMVELRMQKNSLKDLQRRVKLLEKVVHPGIRRQHDENVPNTCQPCSILCQQSNDDRRAPNEYQSHRKSDDECMKCMVACNSKRKLKSVANRAADHHRKVYYSTRMGTDQTLAPLIAEARLSPPIAGEESSFSGTSRLLPQSSFAEGLNSGSSRLLPQSSFAEDLNSGSSRLLPQSSFAEGLNSGSSRLLPQSSFAEGLNSGSSRLLPQSSFAEGLNSGSSRLLPQSSLAEGLNSGSSRLLPQSSFAEGLNSGSSRLLPQSSFAEGLNSGSSRLLPSSSFAEGLNSGSSRLLSTKEGLNAGSSRLLPSSSAGKSIAGAANGIGYYGVSSDRKMNSANIPQARKLVAADNSHEGSRYLPAHLAEELAGSSSSNMRVVHLPLEEHHVY